MTRLYDTIKTLVNKYIYNNTHTFLEKKKIGNKVLKNKEFFTKKKSLLLASKGERD
jgi:hypothetical protein